jgi:hypothetical protein
MGNQGSEHGHEGGAIFPETLKLVHVRPDKGVGLDLFKAVVDKTVLQWIG